MPKLIERFRAAAFDLDGTLVDTMPDLTAAVNLMLGMLGANEIPEPRVRALVGNGVDQLVVRALTESLGKPPAYPAQRSAALTLFRRLYRNTVYKNSEVYPGVEQTLRSLSEAGIPLCCITNKDSSFALPLLEQARLARYFKFTLCADRIEDRKPGPRLLLAACSRLGVAPAEMLYVGDSGIDVAAARAAGCPVVTVTYGYGKDHPAQEANPDGSVDKMTEILTMNLKVATDRPYLKLCPTGGNS
jgi:phosphoglycolate phosphatase